jgi:hypothetical protein
LRVSPKPPQVIPKGLLTEAAHAWVITSKYLDGPPLYRQPALLGRFGGTEMSRNTLSASVVRIGLAVQPVITLLRDELLESPIVHGDETEVQVLKEPGRKAQAKSCMRVQMTDGSGPQGKGPPIRLFAYAPSRSLQSAKGLYAGMRSGTVLMSDGHEPCESIAREHRLLHLGCLEAPRHIRSEAAATGNWTTGTRLAPWNARATPAVAQYVPSNGCNPTSCRWREPITPGRSSIEWQTAQPAKVGDLVIARTRS